MEATLDRLEDALGQSFANPALLVRALTHRSRANEQLACQSVESRPSPGDNERLEFLGDAVLGLVVAEALFAAHPTWHEGELTRVRAQLVSRKHMAVVARNIGLGQHLRLSKGEERGGLRTKATVLSNTMEAVIGAMFLDGGMETVRAFARKQIMGETADHLARELLSGAALGNFKSALQEHLQSIGAGTPDYQVRNESGPDHRKRFTIEVRIKPPMKVPAGKAKVLTLAQGMGSTKKLAEQDAARRALQRLNSGEIEIEATLSKAEEPSRE